MRYRTLLALPLMLSAISCATGTTEIVRVVHDYCLLAKGISYSGIGPGQQETPDNVYDTAQTVTDIVAHNIVFTRTCPESVPAATEPAPQGQRGLN